ncbi:MAG: hypothetical protein Q4G63_12915, partial [Bacteroidia bacterium]|nr:hypothetical protein [Bacteroidia bacterium]
MKTKQFFMLIICASLLFSCGGNDEPPISNSENVYKIEISNSENSKFYSEDIVIQLYGTNVLDTSLKNQSEFTVHTSEKNVKILH